MLVTDPALVKWLDGHRREHVESGNPTIGGVSSLDRGRDQRSPSCVVLGKWLGTGGRRRACGANRAQKAGTLDGDQGRTRRRITKIRRIEEES